MRRPIKISIADRLLGIRCDLCRKRERGREKFQWHHVDGNKFNNARWNLVLVHKVCHIGLTRLNGQYKEGNAIRSLDNLSDTRSDIEGERDKPFSPSFQLLDADPKPEESRTRSIEAKNGLLKYLWEEAIPKTETKSEIIHNSPGWINREDPISEACIRRWLDLFSLSRFYPFRFDKLDRIYLDSAIPVERKEFEK